jgi:gluconokinase
MKIVYLKGSFHLLATRLKTRENHYMKADLLLSQLETLEEPEDAIIIDASQPLELIVDQIKNHLMCG